MSIAEEITDRVKVTGVCKTRTPSGEYLYTVDWRQVLTYNADVTMITAMRGIGKTFGLRLQFLKDYHSHGHRFVEVCRHANEIPDVSADYFGRVQSEGYYTNCEFKVEKQRCYIRHFEIDEEGDEKPVDDWDCIGYFVALTQMQSKKRVTYDKVRRICMDEAIIDRVDNHHMYLRDEPYLLANIVSSCTRERETQGANRVKPNVYLLANACDLVNPYFEFYKIYKEPGVGFSWHSNKEFLLLNIASHELAEATALNTTWGRMLSKTAKGSSLLDSRFEDRAEGLIERKPPSAKFWFYILHQGKTYSFWCDLSRGLYWVDDKVPEDRIGQGYSLTTDDGNVNLICARRMYKPMQAILEAHYLNAVRYKSASQRDELLHALAMFGVR